MTKNKLLLFHPALAPYRIDFFNELNSYFETTIYFNYGNVRDQKFNQSRLLEKLDFAPKYLSKGFTIKGRSIRFGVLLKMIKTNPDVIIVSEHSQIAILANFYKIWKGNKVRVYTISDDSIRNSIDRKNIRKWLRKSLTKRLDGIIFNSEKVADWFGENVSPDQKRLVLPIIHDEKKFRNELEKSLGQAEEYKSQYHLKDKKVILFVGRLVSVKNVTTLIKATEFLVTKNWCLVIVGSGNLENELRKEAQESKKTEHIIFTGRLEGEKLNAWFNLADIFVLPSVHEPFGAVVNEALIAGCTVLCSNVAGAQSLIDASNGDLFDSQNPIELASKMDKFLKAKNETNLNTLRENKMPFPFYEKVNFMLKQL